MKKLTKVLVPVEPRIFEEEKVPALLVEPAVELERKKSFLPSQETYATKAQLVEIPISKLQKEPKWFKEPDKEFKKWTTFASSVPLLVRDRLNAIAMQGEPIKNVDVSDIADAHEAALVKISQKLYKITDEEFENAS